MVIIKVTILIKVKNYLRFVISSKCLKEAVICVIPKMKPFDCKHEGIVLTIKQICHTYISNLMHRLSLKRWRWCGPFVLALCSNFIQNTCRNKALFWMAWAVARNFFARALLRSYIPRRATIVVYLASRRTRQVSTAWHS